MAKMKDKILPIKGSSLDVALQQLPNPKLHFTMDLEEPYYYSNHSNAATLTNDSSQVVLHVFKYLAIGEKMDAALIRQELESFLDLLQPGWKEKVIKLRFLPNVTVCHRLPMVEDESVFSNFDSAITGIYIAGDWVSTHAMLADGAIISGKDAAWKIIEKGQELMNCSLPTRCMKS